ncbi:hypothetical protein D0T84_01095 [Dysgonomonas sp. 521]|uniref:hypothetical protein n=1 Tax=Dysgonomonas sp. 521 TaxID=2302932 RepID=UPI0013D091E1|nr:hypothetical protein [Dysgonomonas sp. 521]NDV93512.1 hypothetical protein [Dysgonomonas sp. 521]
MRTKDYKKPQIDIAKAYSIDEVANVLGITRRHVDRINPNNIFSRSVKYLNKRYFEKDRVIEYQEDNILSNLSLLLGKIEEKINYFDYNTEETIEVEFMNVTIEVGIVVRGFEYRCIELVDIDHNRSYVDAYNIEYDELPRLIEELKSSVRAMVERINKENEIYQM